MEGDTPKQLLPLGETTLLGRVIEVASSTSLDPLVVVTGHEAERIEAVGRSGAGTVRPTTPTTPRRQPDVAASRARRRSRELEAAMLLLADNPGIEPAVIEELAAAWLELRPFAAAVSYRGEVGHPFVLSAASHRAASPRWKARSRCGTGCRTTTPTTC